MISCCWFNEQGGGDARWSGREEMDSESCFFWWITASMSLIWRTHSLREDILFENQRDSMKGKRIPSVFESRGFFFCGGFFFQLFHVCNFFIFHRRMKKQKARELKPIRGSLCSRAFLISIIIIWKEGRQIHLSFMLQISFVDDVFLHRHQTFTFLSWRLKYILIWK